MLGQWECIDRINTLHDMLEREIGTNATAPPTDIYNSERAMRQYSLIAQGVAIGAPATNADATFGDGIGIFPNQLPPKHCAASIALYKDYPDIVEYVDRQLPTGTPVKSSADIYMRFHCMGHPNLQLQHANVYEAVTRAVIAYLWHYPGSLFYNARRTHEMVGEHNIYNTHDIFSRSMFVDAPQLQRYRAKRDGYPLYHAEWTPEYSARRRRLAYIVYLNDVEEGGETIFLNQRARLRPKAGTVIVFPAWDTHLHKGATPLSNDKYIATGWVNTLPEEPR